MFKKTLLFLIIASFLLAGQVSAQAAELGSAGILPDSPFYFLDTWWESITLLLTFDIQEKINKALDFAQEKLAEAEKMMQQDKSGPLGKALDKYQAYVATAAEEARQAKDEDVKIEDLIIVVTKKVDDQQKAALGGMDKISSADKKRIEDAISDLAKAMKQLGQKISCKDSLDCWPLPLWKSEKCVSLVRCADGACVYEDFPDGISCRLGSGELGACQAGKCERISCDAAEQCFVRDACKDCVKSVKCENEQCFYEYQPDGIFCERGSQRGQCQAGNCVVPNCEKVDDCYPLPAPLSSDCAAAECIPISIFLPDGTVEMECDYDFKADGISCTEENRPGKCANGRCVVPPCGDGQVEAPEQCDPPGSLGQCQGMEAKTCGEICQWGPALCEKQCEAQCTASENSKCVGAKLVYCDIRSCTWENKSICVAGVCGAECASDDTCPSGKICDLATCSCQDVSGVDAELSCVETAEFIPGHSLEMRYIIVNIDSYTYKFTQFACAGGNSYKVAWCGNVESIPKEKAGDRDYILSQFYGPAESCPPCETGMVSAGCESMAGPSGVEHGSCVCVSADQ